jgi:hypothetical protein
VLPGEFVIVLELPLGLPLAPIANAETHSSEDVKNTLAFKNLFIAEISLFLSALKPHFTLFFLSLHKLFQQYFQGKPLVFQKYQ